jgi:hypothetical protein
MKIDSEKIISETIADFTSSVSQKKKFAELKSFVSNKDYESLHKDFLTPTKIQIDVSLFLSEIEKYSNNFYQWGNRHTSLPRYGLALVNQDGQLKANDPINGSLHEWNILYPENPLIETDFLIPTEVFNLDSLQPLKVFEGHWCRSNVLKWHRGAHFKPHIDAILPCPWYRLWATTDVENFRIRYDNGLGELVNFENLEAGRLYIIDTSLVHDAESFTDNVYQLFLSVLPSAGKILKERLF